MTHTEHEKVKLAKLLGMWVTDKYSEDCGIKWWCYIGENGFELPWTDYDWRWGNNTEQEIYELQGAEMVLAELGKLIGERLSNV